MMKNKKKSLMTILLLIGITCATLAYIGVSDISPGAATAAGGTQGHEIIAIETKLTQKKILENSEGTVAVALTLTGADLPVLMKKEPQPVDLVVVLDRSGSMGGQKINDARNAVTQLIQKLSSRDRFALITYSNNVETLSPLVHMHPTNLEDVSSVVRRIQASGGTNLGAGLKQGIANLVYKDGSLRQRKVILISDGLANQGITSPSALGGMAAKATEHNLAISTVGVGYDFNEVLMTTIADHGSGNYYFLENPQAFANIFEKEFEIARNVIASSVELRIPLKDGVQLVNAGGYPIRRDGKFAVIRPGNILSGQQRKLFLTFQVPTHQIRNFSLGRVQVQYHHQDTLHSITDTKELIVACVKDKKAVIASIDKETWSEQVVKENYNKLKNDVATAIRKGKKEEALKTIEEYESHTQSMNQSVGSVAVSDNLEKDVKKLRQSVKDTFQGAPAAVAEKKKQQAKTLQYESYQVRRDKK